MADTLYKQLGGYDAIAAVADNKGMGITESDLVVFATHVVATLDAFKVPDRERGEVLGFVESLKKDIVD